MGLFSKIKDSASATIHNETRNCPICGTEIKFIKGYVELQDANICKTCAAKASKFYSYGKKFTTLEMFQEHLAYREKNQEEVDKFNSTKVLGKTNKVYFDEDHNKFIITDRSNCKDGNPDVFSYDMVTGVNLDINEGKTELSYKDEEGTSKHYSPSQYDYHYSFSLTMHINHPYYSSITFTPCNTLYIKNALINGSVTNAANKTTTTTQSTAAKKTTTTTAKTQTTTHRTVNTRLSTTWKPDVSSNVDYQENLALANEIKESLTQVREIGREEHKLICPYCDKTGTPNPDGSCPFCGAPME